VGVALRAGTAGLRGRDASSRLSALLPPCDKAVSGGFHLKPGPVCNSTPLHPAPRSSDLVPLDRQE